MNIIFLDFDGVIVTRRTSFRYFDEVPLNWLKKIVAETNSKIVVTSTWRKHTYFENIRRMFEERGFSYYSIHSCVPDCNSERRGDEITSWLEEHIRRNEDFKYIVIDDESFDIAPHLERLVKVDGETGITEADADKAIQMLQERPENETPVDSGDDGLDS